MRRGKSITGAWFDDVEGVACIDVTTGLGTTDPSIFTELMGDTDHYLTAGINAIKRVPGKTLSSEFRICLRYATDVGSFIATQMPFIGIEVLFFLLLLLFYCFIYNYVFRKN